MFFQLFAVVARRLPASKYFFCEAVDIPPLLEGNSARLLSCSRREEQGGQLTPNIVACFKTKDGTGGILSGLYK